MRICSLLPSATEIVASLGLAESLVAVSEECDWPPAVRGLPVVTASRVEATRLSSFEIELAVRAVSADTVDQLCATDAEVVALDAHTLAEIKARILELAGRLGVPERAKA